MVNLKHLFTFPIVMVDGDNEEKKNEMADKIGMDVDDEVDLIIGEASLPYYDFVSVTDRWLPTQESLDRALSKPAKFDACGVLFSQSGTYIVPWTKERFKKKLEEFIAKQPAEERVAKISKEDFLEFIKKEE